MLYSCFSADGAQVNRPLLCAHHLNRRPQNRHALLTLYSCFTHALLQLYSCLTHALLMLYSCFTQLYSCFTHALLLKFLFALIILIVGPKMGTLYSALLGFTHSLLTHALLVLYSALLVLYSCTSLRDSCVTDAGLPAVVNQETC